MKNSSNNTSAGGMSFCGVLTLIFVVLKLCKVITWSWVWVLSPIWISWGLALMIIGVATLILICKKED